MNRRTLVHQRECNTTFCPPEQIQVITHIKHVPLLKVKSFLHQKYIAEGLTINQIAALTMSSGTTVKKSFDGSAMFGASVQKACFYCLDR